MSIGNHEDIIDSRDVMERIEELQDERYEWIQEQEEAFYELNNGDDVEPFDGIDPEVAWHNEHTDEGCELDALLELQEDAQGYCPDWTHGATLIRDSHFRDYAEELAEEIGAVDRNASWPMTYIDWDAAAEALQQDYTAVDFDGVTYWVQ